jgi:hypothetical protein
MANNELDAGFEEVPLLDDGFEEVALDASQADTDKKVSDGFDLSKKNPLPYIGGVGLTLGKSLANAVGGDFEGGASSLDDVSRAYKTNVQQLQDTQSGMAQGALLGGDDEIKGAVRALADKASGKNRNLSSLVSGDDRDIGSLYRKYQKMEEAKYNQAKERNPGSTLLGEVGGSVATGIATGGSGIAANASKAMKTVGGVKKALELGGKTGALKEIGKMAVAGGLEGLAQGAIQGGLQSESDISDVDKLVDDVVSGATFGLAAGSVIPTAAGGAQLKGELAKQSAKETSEFAMNNPRLRQMGKIYDRAKQGLPSGGEDRGLDYAAEKTGIVDDLTDKFLNASKSVGTKLQNAYKAAESSGIKIPINQGMSDSADALQIYAKNSPFITEMMERNPQYRKTLNTIFNIKSTQLSPVQARVLKDEVFNISERLKDPQLKAIVSDFGKSIKEAADTATPEIKKLSDQWYELNKFGSETIGLKGANPNALSGYESIDKIKLQEDIKDLLDVVSTPGVKKSQVNYILDHLRTNLAKVDAEHPGTLKELGFDSIKDIENTFKQKADLFAMENVLHGGSGVGEVISSSPLKAVAQGVESPVLTKGTYKLADLAGTGVNYASKLPGVKLAKSGVDLAKGASDSGVKSIKRVYNQLNTASNEELGNIANSLINSGDPKAASLGKYLMNSVENKSSSAKNAAIFVIQGDPKMRQLLRDLIPGDDENEQRE